jgi:hypothetical protein
VQTKVRKFSIPTQFIHESRAVGRVLEYYGGFTNSAKNIITACPRSGTRYTAVLLEKSGIDMKHEAIRKDGVVSWQHIADKELVVDCDNVIHQTRDPLKVISSIGWTLEKHAWNFINYIIPFELKDLHEIGMSFENRMKFAMHVYDEWNELIEKRAKHRFKIEDIQIVYSDLLVWLNVKYREPVWPDSFVNVIPHNSVTWPDLYEVDSKLAAKVELKARKYGYL